MKKTMVIVAAALMCVVQGVGAEEVKDQFNPVNTGVNSLGIAPDAR